MARNRVSRVDNFLVVFPGGVGIFLALYQSLFQPDKFSPKHLADLSLTSSCQHKSKARYTIRGTLLKSLQVSFSKYFCIGDAMRIITWKIGIRVFLAWKCHPSRRNWTCTIRHRKHSTKGTRALEMSTSLLGKNCWRFCARLPSMAVPKSRMPNCMPEKLHCVQAARAV